MLFLLLSSAVPAQAATLLVLGDSLSAGYGLAAGEGWVALGANDGLRGLPLSAMRRNLEAIVARARAHGARVLLVGMRLPPNYGPQYADGFRRVYRDLAASRQLPLVPFLLDGVALDPALMQADGLHPAAAAQPRLEANVWRVLAPLLSLP